MKLSSFFTSIVIGLLSFTLNLKAGEEDQQPYIKILDSNGKVVFNSKLNKSPT